MKTIAVIFSHAPHGSSFGREGLDAVLSISAILKKISLFFIGDGVLQLIKSYQTKKILSRNYVSSFSILPILDIKNFYCCKSSLIERGLFNYRHFVLNTTILNKETLYLKLDNYDAIINF
ncbi:sulfurtransferase complex subunit TusC [Buchnera aphidicola (Muscaphis stroyani)]|uniref:Sulfurtransferase complex subunit TusC n=1 Tax=Buchnera aphidicola (Muscaphis stroyani) TaxID=1241869 RepID=A0A4D6Y836_9GAMM|nr:sulfurtransferase complex subunit TusC [Buchnera aphidicola]QCI24563.1 sulfurtransferase complex subunit TusC [Buchnera aphidicola (Muscaphis stroyani)]